MEAAARLQVAIDDARSRLRVTRLEVKPLEAGGAELHFSFVNESEQTIHYVYYGVTFYDAEGTVISLSPRARRSASAWPAGCLRMAAARRRRKRALGRRRTRAGFSASDCAVHRI